MSLRRASLIMRVEGEAGRGGDQRPASLIPREITPHPKGTSPATHPYAGARSRMLSKTSGSHVGDETPASARARKDQDHEYA